MGKKELLIDEIEDVPESFLADLPFYVLEKPIVL